MPFEFNKKFNAEHCQDQPSLDDNNNKLNSWRVSSAETFYAQRNLITQGTWHIVGFCILTLISRWYSERMSYRTRLAVLQLSVYCVRDHMDVAIPHYLRYYQRLATIFFRKCDIYIFQSNIFLFKFCISFFRI